MKRLASLFVLALVACAGDPDRPPPVATTIPPGVGGTPNRATDAGTTLDDGGTASCGTEPFDVEGDTTFGGPGVITGTIQLPASMPVNTTVVVLLDSTDSTRASRFETKLTRATDRVTYRVRGLLFSAGEGGGLDGGFAGYVLRAGINQAGTADIGETGDLDGFYDGTSSGAIFDRANARPFAVKDLCTTALDFGLGVRL